ncbi:MAG: organic hydroperoxide resistance protein [Pseudomonadota bacterium]
MDVLYTARATATGGGRDGRSRTDDGKVDVSLSVPKAMGGDDGAGTNPEQLFATGYAACFLGALRLVSKEAGTPVGPDTEVHSSVGFGKNTKGDGFNLDIELKVSNTGLDAATAQTLVERAHEVCPYSNATRGGVDVRVSAQ